MMCSHTGCVGFQFPWNDLFTPTNRVPVKNKVSSIPLSVPEKDTDDTAEDSSTMHLHSISLEGSFGDIEEDNEKDAEGDSIYFHARLEKDNRYQWNENLSIRRMLRISTIQEEYLGDKNPQDCHSTPEEGRQRPRLCRQSVLRDSGNDMDVVFPRGSWL